MSPSYYVVCGAGGDAGIKSGHSSGGLKMASVVARVSVKRKKVR